MPTSLTRLALVLLLSLPGAVARAQVFESVGTRALGMGGAFVAVADDATAPYWNPAGLASGAFLDARIDRSAAEAVPPIGALPGAFRLRSTYLAVTTPVLGVSYLSLHTATLVPGPAPAVSTGGDRQEDRSERVGLASLATRHLGVTLVQSVLDQVAVGATLRWVRGRAADALAVVAGSSSRELLDQADAQGGAAQNRFDLDLGVMALVGSARVGVVARNVRAPRFQAAGGAAAGLRRQVRAGLAWTPGRIGVPAAPGQAGWTLAVDADLTRTPAAVGNRRMLAVGVERWLLGRRVGVRAGGRTSTAGPARPVGAVGASLAIRSAVLVEAQVTRGHRDGDRGWSVAGRATF